MARKALTGIFHHVGMVEAVASDAIIAMEKTRKEQPDAVVLDLELPRMAS